MKTFLLGTVVAATTVPTKNIVEVAQSIEDLSTLVTAVVAGDLVETLSSPGPFTVFAPSNEAWKLLGTSADLPPAAQYRGQQPASLSPTVDVLLKPENKGQLVEILKFHVLPYQCRAAEPDSACPGAYAPPGSSCCRGGGINQSVAFQETMDGHRGLTTYGSGGGSSGNIWSGIGSYTCDGQHFGYAHFCAEVTGPDNLATNGVVHIINQVLLPQFVPHCAEGIYHPETDSCEACAETPGQDCGCVGYWPSGINCKTGNCSNIDETACVACPGKDCPEPPTPVTTTEPVVV